MGQVDASVIVPVYNQASRLRFTLLSLCNQRLAADRSFEVIAVDDGSTDEVADVLAEFQTELPLRVVSQKNSGRAAARNAGVRASRGSVLLFTDGDRPVCNTWVQCHLDFQLEHERAVGIGDIREFYFSNLNNWATRLMQAIPENFQPIHRLSRPSRYWDFICNALDMQGRCQISTPWVMTLVGNLSIRRDALIEVGQFDESFVGWGFEHYELGFRLHNAGFSFWRVDGATNYHLAHGRPTRFYEDQMKASLQIFHRKHPHPAVEALWHLLHGELSLEQLDRIGGAQECSLPESVRDKRYHPLFPTGSVRNSQLGCNDESDFR